MKFKILLLNIEYGLDLNGSLFEYFLKGYRYLRCRKRVQSRVYMGLQKILKREKPDVCCLIEVDERQKAYLKSRDYPDLATANKYGGWFMARLPKFAKKCHAVLAKEPFTVKKHYLKRGVKKLVYEIVLPNGVHLFIAHLAVLFSSVRQKQLEDLARFTAGKGKVIVCGDFNIYKGLNELDGFIKKTGYTLANKKSDKTFPAYRPKHPLDIFLHSKEIKEVELKVLHDQISDHRPVLLTVET